MVPGDTMNDTTITGGTIWTGSGWVRASLGLKDGRVTTLSARPQPAAEVVDAQGLLVLPGLIDPHVHFGLGVGPTLTADGFSGGSRAAALGGITTVIDFLDPVRTAGGLDQAFAARSALATDSCVDYAFHTTLARPEGPASGFLEGALALGCPSLKVFTTYSSTDRRTGDRAIRDLLAAGARKGTTVLVHAENESLMDLNPGTPVALHEESRPALCEVTAVLTLAELVKETRGRLYVVHVNAGTTVNRLQTLHPELLGRLLFLETCPHYLLWDKTKYQRPDGARFTMTPPLRSSAERRLMAEHFEAFDTLGTDHCAYNAVQKDHPTTDRIPMGIGGVEFLLPSLWGTWGDRCLAKMTTGPAVIHGLAPRKGSLVPGADGDVVLFDPKPKWTVAGHHGDADHTAWEGHPMTGRVVSTVVRGTFVVRDGEFLGGQGKFVRRTPAKSRR
jgi:dihydropyrimidinase